MISEYVTSTLHLLHEKSLLINNVKSFESVNFSFGIFFTVGLEAAGHHLIQTMPMRVINCSAKTKKYGCNKRPGNQLSFSYNGYDRKNKDRNQHNIAIDSLNGWRYMKYLILLRKPYPQFESYTHRYWNINDTTLSHHYDSWISAASQMQIFVHSLVANRHKCMIVSYDHLCTHSHLYHRPFSHFLHISYHILDNWFRKIRKPIHYDNSFKLTHGNWGRWKKQNNFRDAFHSAFKKTTLFSVFTL